MDTLRHCSKGNHDLPDTNENFCGAYRWCRACFATYRKEWRKTQREKILALRASDAPLCVVCTSKPVARKGAHRCPACITTNLYRCPCGRTSHNPTCGKCRGIKLRERKAARREAELAKRLRIFTGDGACAKCGTLFARDQVGTPIYREHACDS